MIMNIFTAKKIIGKMTAGSAAAVFCLALAALMCVEANASDWPMFLKDKEHSSYVGKAPMPPYVLKWRFSTKGPVYSSPIVYKNKVYAGSYDKTFYALDAATGKEVWRFASDGEIFGAPAAANGIVYFGSKDGKVYALDADTGKPLWDYATEGKITTSVLESGGVVYAAGSDLYLYALRGAKDAPRGRRVWRMKFADNEFLGGIYSSPVIFEGSVISAGKNGAIYATDIKSGGRNWFKRTDSAIYSPMSVSDAVVYVSSFERKVYALDAKTGKQKWSKDLNGEYAYGAPVIVKDKLYLGLRNGHIKVFDKASGKEKSDFALCDSIDSTPVVTGGGVLIAGCADGGVYAVDVDTGAVIWSYLTGGAIHASVAVTEDAVYIGSLDGSIYAFGR
jgi:outer membrane protein assembly factor BamB